MGHQKIITKAEKVIEGKGIEQYQGKQLNLSQKEFDQRWDYGCDTCNKRLYNDDGNLIWVTTGFGLCTDCYNKFTRDELDLIEVAYE